MGICLIIKSGGGTDTSNATATADKILSGYTIYSNDNKVTGGMTNVGTQTASNLNTGGNTTIKAGWHNGNGVVTTNTLSSQTQCDIPNQWWCLTGYSYWATGSKYDGAMANRGAKSWSIGANGSQTIEDGWHNGSGTVKQSINVDNGEWGPNPTTTNQQLCWQGWYYSKNRWCWGNGNLTAANIKKDITIFGVKGTYYESKRYLIQNGKITGLCTMSMASTSHVSSSVTYNNETWLLLSSHASWYVDSDEGTETLWNTYTVVKNVKAIVNTSYSTGAISGVTLSFRVHGDVLIEPNNGYSAWRGYKAEVGFIYTYGTGNYTSGFRTESRGVVWWVGTQQFIIGQQNPGTMPVAQYTGGNMYKWTSSGPGDGNLAIDLWNYGFSWGHNNCVVSVWVKNLWLDTTESMTF